MELILLYVFSAVATLTGALMPILLDGVERKLKAVIQSRIGPPITQTFYDIVKLAAKEHKSMHTKPFITVYFSSYLLCIVTSMLLATIYAILQDFVILALALAFLAVSLAALTIVPLLVPNPFSYIGGMREVVLALINESSFIVSILVYTTALRTVNSQLVNPLWSIITLFPVTTAMLISGYALTGRAPFDISEAEPELASGTLIEFSGYLLALYIYSSLLKKFSAKLFIAVLITSSVIDGGIPGLITAYALTLVIWIAFSVISSTLGRSRVDLAPRALTKVYIALLAISITGLLVFAYV